MQVSSSASHAAEFNRRLFEFTLKLATHDFVVSNIECKWGHFGSWIVELEDGQASNRYGQALRDGKYDMWGPKVLRILWDGRELELTISESPTPPLSGPTQWKTLRTEPLGSSEEALTFAGEFATRWPRG